MKRIYLLILSLALTNFLLAIPAKRIQKQVTQSDGSKITVQAYGDEHMHYFLTADNIPVLRSPDNQDFCYAQIENNHMVATSRIAHEESIRTQDERTFIKSLNLSSSALSTAKQANASMRKIRSAAPIKKTISGTKHGLVILVNFSDNKFSLLNPKLFYNSFCNKSGYKSNGQNGSVHDYFEAQSNGMFSLDFDVIGPITLSKNIVYYGQNDAYGNDAKPGAMIVEACKAIVDSVNFKDYDWNDDGEVDQVYVLYAGYGEAADANSNANTIWPHEWDLESSDYKQSITLDGVKINTYACSCELAGSSASNDKTIGGVGTICHEFSHCLGLPDFYDTSGSSDPNYGMDTWDLMDYGCYNGSKGNGECPCGYTSYEKAVCGWLEPITLNSAATISSMQPLSQNGNAYIIPNDNYSNEYFLLENRQKVGWDSYAYAAGMLVIHVDYDENAWYNNEVNNYNSHQRMTIVPADGSLVPISTSYQSIKGDPYPGTSNVTSIPKLTTYHITSNGTKSIETNITNITTNTDKSIYLNYKGGGQEPTSVVTAVDTNATSIQSIYSLEGYKINARSLSALRRGFYIISTNNGMKKIYVP
jgi:immune inhibitor A